jgi:hypothetical protein
MKTLIKTTLAISIISCFYACKQNNVNPEPDAGAINVTNAVINGNTVNFFTNQATYLTSGGNQVSSFGYNFIPVAAGQQQITLNIPATPASPGVPATPAVTYYTGTLIFNANTNYSLFLTGTSQNAVDNVLIKETYPRTYAYSVCGVRFIHLATGTNPISVDIAGNANGSEVQSLAYKAYSAFIQHPANNANQSYNFEFRDQASGTLLTTYTLTTPFFHNVTLAFVGNAGSYSIIQDNDF